MTPEMASCFWGFWCFVLGACFGSFLNVCIWRMPRGESVVTAPSHCTKCEHHIAWYDNLPLASYLILRGRCRNCREHYTSRYFWVELLVAGLFFLLFKRHGLDAMFSGGTLILLCVGSSFTDVEHRMIPDAMTYPAMVLALVFCVAPQMYCGISFAECLPRLTASAVSGAGTALVLSGFALLGCAIFRRDALGWGDVKLLTAIAMLYGWQGAFFAMLGGALTGLLFGLAKVCLQKKALNHATIPFGPFLNFFALLWLYFASEIWQGYLAFAGMLRGF